MKNDDLEHHLGLGPRARVPVREVAGVGLGEIDGADDLVSMLVSRQAWGPGRQPI